MDYHFNDGDDYHNDYYGYRYRGSFEQTYRCSSVSDIGKPNLEKGDKIIMPASALDRLSHFLIEFPMLFELRNSTANRVSHCGVMEFTSEEGMIYLPSWMMKNMKFQTGDTVNLKSTNLSKGTYIKLQPHTKDFLDISNPKAILEMTLRSFTCLTTGDTILVSYNNKDYYIDILETKPSNAVCIVETDCEVDFAPPLDYIEPEKPKASIPLGKAKAKVEESVVSEEAKHIPFIGVGRRLDGKPLTQSAQRVASSPILDSHKSETNNGSIVSNSSSQRSGKLVFGSNAKNITKQAEKVIPKNTIPKPQTEEQKFQAFSGKSYSFKG